MVTNPWDITAGSEMFFQVIILSLGKNARNVDIITAEQSAPVGVKILKMRNDEHLCDHEKAYLKAKLLKAA
ncbi:MAG TPA: hypothetical protein VJL54_01195 [Nitrososphaera sp.]|nr:hypothetical protein [Nitrososphaera sp.]